MLKSICQQRNFESDVSSQPHTKARQQNPLLYCTFSYQNSECSKSLYPLRTPQKFQPNTSAALAKFVDLLNKQTKEQAEPCSMVRLKKIWHTTCKKSNCVVHVIDYCGAGMGG